MNKIASVGDEWQLEEVFLDVRREVVEIHDLRDARLRHGCESRQLCQVRNNAIAHQSLEPDCKCHEF